MRLSDSDLLLTNTETLLYYSDSELLLTIALASPLIGITQKRRMYANGIIHQRRMFANGPVSILKDDRDPSQPPPYQTNYMKNMEKYDDLSSRNSAYFMVGGLSVVSAMAAKNAVTDILVLLLFMKIIIFLN